MRNSDMVRTMDAGPRGADEGTFEVQAEHAVIAGSRARRRDGGLRLLPGIGDQRRQARRRAIAPMRARDGPHAFRCRIIVEQNPAAAIDLEVDEAGRQQGAVRQPSLRPVAWNLAPCR